MDWKTAKFSDFQELDNQLYPKLPDAYLEGTHLALSDAILHSAIIRKDSYYSQYAYNQMAAFRFIKDHGDLPLTPETILSIYGSMLDSSTKAEWKKSNVYLESSDSFYVTLPADETPKAMEDLCQKYAFPDSPPPELFDKVFEFILDFICIHPFQDGNGRMSALLLQFLLQKCGLRCAVFLPLDLIQNGVYMKRITLQIRKASGAFYGMKPMKYDTYTPFMKEILAQSYLVMLNAVEKV